MRAAQITWGAALVLALSACGSPTIRDLNASPSRYYQHKVTIVGQISRVQELGGEALIELVGPEDMRIYVRAPTPLPAAIGDWVKITGVLVPEAQIGGRTVYDVLQAEETRPTRPPRFRHLF
ncbi:MAG TPA: hypothetical protein VKW76_12305 [Candidatus Binatia bacterium]|nr:hypothetical protein [Candidatus Binatia bacterium]